MNHYYDQDIILRSWNLNLDGLNVKILLVLLIRSEKMLENRTKSVKMSENGQKKCENVSTFSNENDNKSSLLNWTL